MHTLLYLRCIINEVWSLITNNSTGPLFNVRWQLDVGVCRKLNAHIPMAGPLVVNLKLSQHC